jgi:PTH2 family peptidyl-tRNA hydrolase
MSDEWKVPVDESEDKPKMVIVVRKDLKMPRGKIAAQASHAAVGAVIKALYDSRLEETDFHLDVYAYKIRKNAYADSATKDWLAGEFTKICVCVDSEEELLDVYNKAEEAELNVCLITDNGHTCFNGVPTKTCLAIGPCYSSLVDPITGNLKLYN